MIAEVPVARAGVLLERPWTFHLSAGSLAAPMAGAHWSLRQRQVVSCRLQCFACMSWLKPLTG